MDGRWVPTFPNAKYILAEGEYAASEAAGTTVFNENVLPIMEAGQAMLVQETRLIELLREEPGINVVRTGNLQRNASIHIRGADPEHTLILIDGFDANFEAGFSPHAL